MKKTLGRLAGAVLAGALISLAVTPSAFAQEDNGGTPTTSEVATPPTSDTPVTDAPASDTPSSDAPASSQAPSSSDNPPATSGQPTETSQPGDPGNPGNTGEPSDSSTPTTSGSEETSTPEEPPYVDDSAYGIDFDGGQGLFVIACAAGEPTNVSSSDFDLLEGPHQDETDGRYWGWLVQRHDGVSFDAGNVTATWTCGGDQTGDQPVPPAGGAGAGSAGTTNGDGTSQVKYAPKGGVETGFGGMAA
ncbi:hypothetical protein ACQPXB_00395 [Amycolatopsis sp. CA-161197]|uniref:hypothetical protein n=1 Tax=unclassified Amycolatopsis TaxID=2618356 RepID=UPI003454C633